MSASIDDFEEERAPDRYYDEQLRLSWFDRRCKLIRMGFTDQELKRAVEQSYKTRRRREQSIQSMSNESFEMLKESLFRKIRRRFHPREQLTTRY